MSQLYCKYSDICSGCPDIKKNLNEQITSKKELLLQKLPQLSHQDIKILRPAEDKFRDKIDLTIEDGKIGFYQKNIMTIFDMEDCPLLSPALQTLYKKFRKVLPPIKKGSVRLRVAPNGLCGLWLDISNLDIKFLLEEKISLIKMLQYFDVIEIGQKAKNLTVVKDKTILSQPQAIKFFTSRPSSYTANEVSLKLSEGLLHPWFETYIFQGEQILTYPLFMRIKDFSQTGFITNKVLIREFSIFLEYTNTQSAVELCSGSGNFTLPLLRKLKNVTALEINNSALEGLQKTYKDFFNPLFGDLHIKVCNIHKDNRELEEILDSQDLLVVDPPRSGLGIFLNLMQRLKSVPHSIIYISCHSQSLTEDLLKLFSMGYQLKKIIGVDQFPHTQHCEWIVLLQK